MSYGSSYTKSESKLLKEKGNECFKKCKFNEALEYYNESIRISPNSINYCNRSAVFYQLYEYRQSLIDSKECIRFEKSWWKGYYRASMACYKLKRFKRSKKYLKVCKKYFDDGVVVNNVNKREKEKMRIDNLWKKINQSDKRKREKDLKKGGLNEIHYKDYIFLGDVLLPEIFQVIKNGEIDKLKRLIEKDKTLLNSQIQGNNLLHCSAVFEGENSNDIIMYLLENCKISIKSINYIFLTPIDKAIQSDKSNNLRLFLTYMKKNYSDDQIKEILTAQTQDQTDVLSFTSIYLCIFYDRSECLKVFFDVLGIDLQKFNMQKRKNSLNDKGKQIGLEKYNILNLISIVCAYNCLKYIVNSHSKDVKEMINKQSGEFGNTCLHFISEGNRRIQAVIVDSIYQFTPQRCFEFEEECNHKKMIELLINLGADVGKNNYKGKSPLYIASKNGHFNVSKFLADRIRVVDNESFLIACFYNHIDVVEYFYNNYKDSIDLNYKSNENQFTPLSIAVWNQSTELTEFLLKKGARNWSTINSKHLMKVNKFPMLIPFISNNIHISKLMIDYGFKFSENEFKYLLLHGDNALKLVRVVVKSKSLNLLKEDDKGKICMWFAINSGSLTLVKLILSEMLTRYNRIVVAKALIKKGGVANSCVDSSLGQVDIFKYIREFLESCGLKTGITLTDGTENGWKKNINDKKAMDIIFEAVKLSEKETKNQKEKEKKTKRNKQNINEKDKSGKFNVFFGNNSNKRQEALKQFERKGHKDDFYLSRNWKSLTNKELRKEMSRLFDLCFKKNEYQESALCFILTYFHYERFRKVSEKLNFCERFMKLIEEYSDKSTSNKRVIQIDNQIAAILNMFTFYPVYRKRVFKEKTLIKYFKRFLLIDISESDERKIDICAVLWHLFPYVGNSYMSLGDKLKVVYKLPKLDLYYLVRLYIKFVMSDSFQTFSFGISFCQEFGVCFLDLKKPSIKKSLYKYILKYNIIEKYIKHGKMVNSMGLSENYKESLYSQLFYYVWDFPKIGYESGLLDLAVFNFKEKDFLYGLMCIAPITQKLTDKEREICVSKKLHETTFQLLMNSDIKSINILNYCYRNLRGFFLMERIASKFEKEGKIDQIFERSIFLSKNVHYNKEKLIDSEKISLYRHIYSVLVSLHDTILKVESIQNYYRQKLIKNGWFKWFYKYFEYLPPRVQLNISTFYKIMFSRELYMNFLKIDNKSFLNSVKVLCNHPEYGIGGISLLSFFEGYKKAHELGIQVRVNFQDDGEEQRMGDIDCYYCYYCSIKLYKKNRKRCGGCKKVYYCSTNCQKNDWKKHKPICQALF